MVRLVAALLAAVLLGCADSTGPGAEATITPDGKAWVVVLGGGEYYCRVPVDGGAGTVRYETAASAIRACREIRDGWVPPWSRAGPRHR